MRGRTHLLARGLLLALLGSSVSREADAGRSTIRVGEVSARVAGADATTEGTLRALVAREIGRLELDHPTRPDAYVLSASLVRLDARTSSEGSRATCVVSATLRRAGTGVLLAMMRGSGTAEDERSALEGAKARALEAAVHGAVRRVPDAL
jgi:hypothetical protein